MIERLLSTLGVLGVLATPSVSEEAGAARLARDRAAILGQCGCFEVTFAYRETAAVQPGYARRPPKTVKGLEWVEADRVTERSVSLQHLLIGPQGRVQKHWRQVWDYEPTALFEYQGRGRWQKRRLDPQEARGKWAQRVYEVDDGPRYEGLGAWDHTGASYWVSKAWSPLPRREFTQRQDYDVLARTNRHQLSAEGWEHVQENAKIKLEGETPVVLVREHGENRYRRVDDAHCAAARTYWSENRQTWHRIQGVWQDVYDRSERVTLRHDPDATARWQRLFAIAASPSPRLEAEVRAVIRAERAP